ncbi:response regulator transcription factor [Planosporangium mesophilum]|uniref:response regulator transcription factor n=1 Tax=Planosporangium mesophilum TaxID=689768 RepID=UPI001EF278D4|nr:response regulator transcription factor [Planosporangium mesophilum]
MRILVVDDEAAVRDSLSRTLRFEGYEVAVAEDGLAAVDLIRRQETDTVVADAVIMDVMMPRMDGLEACRLLRSEGLLIPVLMLTARDSVGDRVAGLDAGADDYLVKPFALQELLARLRALLRRSLLTGPNESVEPARAGTGAAVLAFADLTLDPATREVRRGDREMRLTRTEFAILEVFLRHPRQVLTRPILFEHVWGYDFGETSNSLHVYLGYLRRKLEADGEPRLLHTVRGVGYVLREQPL